MIPATAPPTIAVPNTYTPTWPPPTGGPAHLAQRSPAREDRSRIDIDHATVGIDDLRVASRNHLIPGPYLGLSGYPLKPDYSHPVRSGPRMSRPTRGNLVRRPQTNAIEATPRTQAPPHQSQPMPNHTRQKCQAKKSNLKRPTSFYRFMASPASCNRQNGKAKATALKYFHSCKKGKIKRNSTYRGPPNPQELFLNIAIACVRLDNPG